MNWRYACLNLTKIIRKLMTNCTKNATHHWEQIRTDLNNIPHNNTIFELFSLHISPTHSHYKIERGISERNPPRLELNSDIRMNLRYALKWILNNIMQVSQKFWNCFMQIARIKNNDWLISTIFQLIWWLSSL